MNTDTFVKAYARLNPAQKEAVDTIEGPVMVIAGPGTGKTQILTLRIVNILRNTDAKPNNILALTFTESGARAMRERLHAYIGSAAYRVNIHTFHEFAGRLIRTYPDAYERAVGGRPATDLEKMSIIGDIIETQGIKQLRPHGNPSYYIKPILNALALLKREYITPDAFATIIATQENTLAVTPKFHEKGAHKGKIRSDYQKREKELKKNQELLYIYRAYIATLTERNLYDFEDMIFETVRALEHTEDMLRDLQEQFLYILADEHQDVNGSQNRILELLASFHDRPNLFVVGDEKQAIFRFQGASLENFLYFEEHFKHTKTIALTENYRSTQEILDLAHALITQEPSPAADLRVALTATTPDGGVIELRVTHHEAVENELVVERLEKLIRDGTSPNEIAIIVRSNREVELFATALRARNIPVNATADSDILEHPITTAVCNFITTVIDPRNEEALFTLLHQAFWGITRDDLVRVLRERTFARPLASIITDSTFLSTCELKNQPAIERVASVLSEARNRMLLNAPHRVLEYMLTESGFIDHVMRHDPLEGGRVLRRVYDEIESLVASREAVTLADIERLFQLRITHALPLKAPYIHAYTDAVTVMTAHKSKGLEFEHVFVPHLTDARWGETTPTQHFSIPLTQHIPNDAYSNLDDERKLLYVAITRAKRGLYLSYASENTDGRPRSPSPLIVDLQKHDAVLLVDTHVAEHAFNPLAGIVVPPTAPLVSLELLRSTLTERGLSATSLNNYLRSPWTYLYRNVFRIPSLQDESAQFGTALHNTMRAITMVHAKEGVLPKLERIKEFLERELATMALTVAEYTRLHERGMIALHTYLTAVGESIPKRTEEERHFEARLETGLAEVPSILLTGSLDRLDYSDDGHVVRVVDYKSGKPRTRGYIEGTTKDSTGDYKRQLTFYALLLSLQNDVTVHTRTGLVSFIEPDDKNQIHEELYTITDDEIQNLKSEIIRVAAEIANGAFLDAPCDDTICDYCSLVAAFKKLG